MQIKSIMTRDVVTIEPDATLQQAAEKMQSLDMGWLPVCEEHKLLGTLTDRDITVRATAKGMDPAHTNVRSVMTELVVSGVEDQPIKDGVRIMMENQIRRLPILNHEKKLVGIIAMADLVNQDQTLVVKAFKRISEPTQEKEHA